MRRRTLCTETARSRPLAGADPFDPIESWARPASKVSRRKVDKLADAVEAMLRAESRMRRSFRAWDKARSKVERLNRRLET